MKTLYFVHKFAMGRYLRSCVKAAIFTEFEKKGGTDLKERVIYIESAKISRLYNSSIAGKHLFWGCYVVLIFQRAEFGTNYGRKFNGALLYGSEGATNGLCEHCASMRALRFFWEHEQR